MHIQIGSLAWLPRRRLNRHLASTMIPLLMTQPSAGFIAPSRVLLGPGPSDVSPRVLAALASPTIGHLDPEYLRIMDDTRRMLREVFRTANELTLAVSGTGSAGMEAAIVNLIEPGDEMIVCVNGVFGGGMRGVGQGLGGGAPFGEG